MIDHLRDDPHFRVRAAWYLLWLSVAGALMTHSAILLTQPQGFTTWTAHLLLGLSWFAITLSALILIVTTDVRDKQENDGGS